MPQATIKQQDNKKNNTKKMEIVKPSVDDAIVGGLKLEGSDDDNLIARYSIADFMDLDARLPLIDGKVRVRENTNGTRFVGAIVNNTWHNIYLSKTLQGETKGKEDLALKVGDAVSLTKHAVQLRFNPEADSNEEACYYLLVAAGSIGNVATKDNFETAFAD